MSPIKQIHPFMHCLTLNVEVRMKRMTMLFLLLFVCLKAVPVLAGDSAYNVPTDRNQKSLWGKPVSAVRPSLTDIESFFIDRPVTAFGLLRSLSEDVVSGSFENGGKVSALPRIKGHKSPGLAVTFSVIFPGLGQHYCGSYLIGAVQEVIFIGGVVLPFLFWEAEDDLIQAMYIAGWGMAAGVWIWSIIDAPLRAAGINRRLTRDFGHLIEFQEKNLTIGLDMGPYKRGLGAGLTMHF